MTEKQRRFVDHYIATANASESARLAGYSEKTSNRIGAENLTKLDIREAIDERLKEMESQRIAQAEESMMFLTSVVRGDFKEELTTPSGKIVKVQIPTAQRIKAAETLLKIQGMFRDKIDVNVDGAQLFVDTLTKISAKLEDEND